MMAAATTGSTVPTETADKCKCRCGEKIKYSFKMLVRCMDVLLARFSSDRYRNGFIPNVYGNWLSEYRWFAPHEVAPASNDWLDMGALLNQIMQFDKKFRTRLSSIIVDGVPVTYNVLINDAEATYKGICVLVPDINVSGPVQW